MQHGARRKLDIKRLMRFSFSTGSEAWNWFVLSVIPRNSRDVEGPSVFSADRGTLRLEKTDFRMTRPEAGGDEGGEMMRKSSRRCTRNGILWLLAKIQQRASARLSKSLGLLLQPKVSLTAK